MSLDQTAMNLKPTSRLRVMNLKLTSSLVISKLIINYEACVTHIGGATIGLQF